MTLRQSSGSLFTMEGFDIQIKLASKNGPFSYYSLVITTPEPTKSRFISGISIPSQIPEPTKEQVFAFFKSHPGNFVLDVDSSVSYEKQPEQV